MSFQLKELTHKNFPLVWQFDRSDISDEVVYTVYALKYITDYSIEHICLGHAFVVSAGE